MSSPGTAAAASSPDDARPVAGRLPYLVTSQILGGIGVACGISVGGLLAEQISGSTSMAGLAQTSSTLGGALLAVPMATMAERRGRGPALSTGYGIAFLGAFTALLASVVSSTGVLLLGMGLFGAASTVGLQARYAAIDGVGAAHRARTLSIVMWATTIGVVLGPNLSEVGGRLGHAVGLADLAGPFLFSLIAFALGSIVLSRLPGGRQPLAHQQRPGHVWSALGDAVRRPAALTALVTMSAAHATMVGVMSMTPVHLHHEGGSLTLIGLVISVHVIGMYAFSPLMGMLTDRVGAPVTIMFGVFVLFISLLVAATAAPMAHGQVMVALFLLGLGWSPCIVAGSAMLSASVPVESRTRVQGGGDLIVGLSAALAGVASGPILGAAGYNVLAASTMVLLLPVAVLVIVCGPRQRTWEHNAH